jgi:hypothetical protein
MSAPPQTEQTITPCYPARAPVFPVTRNDTRQGNGPTAGLRCNAEGFVKVHGIPVQKLEAGELLTYEMEFFSQLLAVVHRANQ